jgi:hypothetical protein
MEGILMVNFSVETAIIVSFILGLALPVINLGGVISIFIMGFAATYLTKTEDTSAIVGGIAAIVFGVVFFFVGFLTGPTLPYTLPSPLALGVLVPLTGLFYLLLGLIVTIVIYGAIGLLGGYIAFKFFKEKREKKSEFEPRRPQRTLKRS